MAEASVEVWVVNARHVKRVPGRKTDVSDKPVAGDAGALRSWSGPSFVAPPQLEELRRLTRLYARTRRVASTLRKHACHRMLDESGLRIGGILTDLFGLSGRNLLDGLVAGLDPDQMVAGVKGKARKKIPALLDALGCGLDEGAKPLVVLLREMQDAVERFVGADGATHSRCGQTRLRVALDAAADVARNGTAGRGRPCWPKWANEMDAFGTARRLASWAGMCPGNHESAGKRKGGKRRKGNVYLRRILCEISRTRRRARAMCSSDPTSSASRAVAAPGGLSWRRRHKILRIAFALLRDRQPYRDPEVDYQAQTAIRNKARWGGLKMLRKANLLQEVAKAAAEQLRGAPAGTGTGPPPSGAVPEPIRA